MDLKRSVPTPRARRIFEEIGTLTVRDVLWMRDELLRLLGEPPEGAGVREPRRPLLPTNEAAVGLELPWIREQDGA